MSDEQVQHVRTKPISTAIIDICIEEILDWVEKNELYSRENSLYFEMLRKGSKTPKVPQSPGSPNLDVSNMFHLAIGGGIEKYRQYLIDKLISLGDKGELIWKKIIEGTERMENHLQSNTDILYPRTLTEAKAVYGNLSRSNDSQ